MEEKETIQPIEITWEELQSRDLDRYILVDTRGDEAVNYGMIPGAIAIPECELVDKLAAAAGDKKVILYCSRGQNSKVSAEYFREQGMEAYSLQGGYTGWLLNLMQKEQPGEKENERAREIEKSIRKKFHKVLFSRFAKAINEYDMIQENDKIAVCISGGKDSMLMAKLFQELKRHNKFPFELVFLVMDPGYSEANRKIIENNAKLMDIPITIFESQIFDAVYDIEDSPCYLCARMRRGYLYSHAKELGCNKIALGHHYDDVIETILMGMLYGGQVQTMMPKLNSTNFDGMQLIRPLADKKHLEFDTDYKKLRFENVVGDAKRIRQLCINLLSNAVKYTEDGGKIYFSISERGVVKEETDNIYMEYEIIVKDNGIGISEEFMPYLFDMFEREKKVLGENISGTGLGMTIARNLARLMDGDIYVESKENEGTKFSVTLRLRLPAPDESVTTDDINMGISGGVIRF